MAKHGDITRPRSVKAKFEGVESGTGSAGAVLIEKTLRRLSMKRMIQDHLPSRPESCEYSTFDVWLIRSSQA